MPFQKTKKMTIPAYVCTSLELLMNGSLYLSTVIHMFTNKTVIPPAKYKLVITGTIKVMVILYITFCLMVKLFNYMYMYM